MNISVILLAALASGGAGLLYALVLVALGAKRGDNEKARSVAKAIQGGASAFLKREYVALALVAIPIAFALTYLGQWTANGFIAGAVGSVLVGYLGAVLALQANARTVEVAGLGIGPALRVAFRGGSAAGLAAAGLALLGVAGYYALARLATPVDEAFRALLGLGLGSSLAGLFARLAGGLYTNAAEAGANLSSDNQLDGLAEDGSNPAIIASNVAGNVGEAMGLATDLYESYTLTLVAAMLLAKNAFGNDSPWVEFPLLVGSVSLVATFLGGFFVRVGKRKRTLGALYRGLLVTALLTGGGFYGAAEWFLTLPGLETAFGPYGLLATILTGVALVGAILLIAEYQTQAGFRPVKRIAAASQGGPAANLFAGLSAGQKSVLLPVLVALAALSGAYFFGGGFSANPWMGLYAVALAAVASLSLGGSAVALSTYASIVGNARSIAEIAELYAIKRSITDPLNAAGNTAKGVARAYVTLSAGLAALVLFAEFSTTFHESADYALNNPQVLAGLLAGGLLAHWLSARLLSAIGIGGERVRAEVRRQWREIPGLADGSALPQHGRCVDIASRNAIRQTLVPVLIVLAVPVAIGLLVGKGALAGFLFGSIATGLLQSLASTGSGSALSNARRHIEAGSYGGNRSAAHEAAVSGEAIGSPLGATVGPAAASLGKLAGVLALLLVPLIS